MSARSDARSVVVWALVVGAIGFVIWWRELRTPRAKPPVPSVPGLAARDADIPSAVSDAPSGRADPDTDGAIADALSEGAPRLVALPGPVPALIDQELYIKAISLDGSRALLTSYLGDREPERIRVVALDTETIEFDLVLRELENWVDLAAPEPLAAIAKVRAVLTQFPGGASPHFAVSPDGQHGAFNRGDPLHAIWNDALGPTIPKLAAYSPLFTPDSKTLMFSGYDGRIDGDGNYSLFTMAVGSKKVTKVKGTEGYGGVVAHAADGTLRIVAGVPPKIPMCVHSIPVVAPFVVADKRCLDGAAHLDGVLSPHGSMVAWETGTEDQRRLRVMDLTTGELVTDAQVPVMQSMVVSDGGRVIATTPAGGLFVERGATAGESIPFKHFDCMLRSETELVCEQRGSVVRFTIR